VVGGDALRIAEQLGDLGQRAGRLVVDTRGPVVARREVSAAASGADASSRGSGASPARVTTCSPLDVVEVGATRPVEVTLLAVTTLGSRLPLDPDRAPAVAANDAAKPSHLIDTTPEAPRCEP
jgi:hypothetical protein